MKFQVKEAIAVVIPPTLGSVVEALRIPCLPECGRERRVDYNIRGIEIRAAVEDYHHESAAAQIDDVWVLPGFDVDSDERSH